MFGCLNKIIKTVIIILAIIGFVSIGGINFIKKYVNFVHLKNNKIELADFSKLNDEFEIVSSGNIFFIGDYAYIKHIASEQKFLFYVPKNQKMLTKEDFTERQTTIAATIQDFADSFNILGFKFEKLYVTGSGEINALGQKIPFVKFKAELSNLPVKGNQGIIGAAKTKNNKNAIIISFNTQGKYSQIITSVFLSEVKIDK